MKQRHWRFELIGDDPYRLDVYEMPSGEFRYELQNEHDGATWCDPYTYGYQMDAVSDALDRITRGDGPSN